MLTSDTVNEDHPLPSRPFYRNYVPHPPAPTRCIHTLIHTGHCCAKLVRESAWAAKDAAGANDFICYRPRRKAFSLFPLLGGGGGGGFTAVPV